MPKKGEFVKFKNFERKIKSVFVIYADFESILVTENSGKKIQKGCYIKNIKDILPEVMNIN